MSSFQEIIGELMAVDAELSAYEASLQREQDEINNTMQKAQSTFGDQQAGQGLVNTLYKTLQNTVFAESALNMVRQSIRNRIVNMQK